MIEYKFGDIFENDEHCVIVQQVNLLGVMGAGLALQIKNRYPKCYKVYRKYYSSKNLGDVIWYNDSEKNFHIANLFGQQNVGRGLQTDYNAVDVGIRSVLEYCAEEKIDDIRCPLIGAGLGGGNWDVIEQLINTACQDLGKSISVYVIDPILFKQLSLRNV